MAILNLFSKRQKKLSAEHDDILTYDILPHNLKVQIVHIICDCIGMPQSYHDENSSAAYKFIFDSLCREYGKFQLVPNYLKPEEQVINYLLNTTGINENLDVIELTFMLIDNEVRDNIWKYEGNTGVKLTPDEAIQELNERFRENAIGYSFDGGEIIRVDSIYAHAFITKPTIALLNSKLFEGANEEFMKAHEHYRHSRNKECLNECLKAFESTMKVICKEKRWQYSQHDTAKKLIQICFQNGLVPTHNQNQLTSLQSLLESGVPTIRNRLGGHGQGHESHEVSDGIARYALNLTGSNIIFLIEQSSFK